MLCGRGGISFNNTCLNMLNGIKQDNCYYPLKALFKDDNVNALIKCQIVKTWFSISREKLSKFQCLYCFSWL